MENNIVILHAQEWNQHAMIDFKTYEFEFDLSDLAKVISESYTTEELEAESEIDSANYNDYQKAKEIASYWLHKDVELLIQDFIDNQPHNLSDHLQVTKN